MTSKVEERSSKASKELSDNSRKHNRVMMQHDPNSNKSKGASKKPSVEDKLVQGASLTQLECKTVLIPTMTVTMVTTTTATMTTIMNTGVTNGCLLSASAVTTSATISVNSMGEEQLQDQSSKKSL